MTRRVPAPMTHAHRHGGYTDKAQAGLVINESIPVWAVVRVTCISPGYRTVGRSFRKQRIGDSTPPRGAFFKWVPKCVNTQEPATEARLRGYGCTVEGGLSIPCRRASRKGARCEYVVPRETNSSPFHARRRGLDPLS